MRIGLFFFGKTCWSFNEGGRFLTLSLIRVTNSGYCGLRLWVHGHTFFAGLRKSKPEFAHYYNRVASKREVEQARAAAKR